MKKLILTVGVTLALAGNIFGQAIVNFGNLVGTGGSIVNAPVFDGNCSVKLDGAGFSAQLFAGPAGSSEASLVAVGAAVPFRTGAAAGYWVTTTRTIPGLPEGAPAALQVRVWANQGGAITTYDQAVGAGVSRGVSPLITVVTGGPIPTPPANMVGLQSICLNPLQMANAFASRAQVAANAGAVRCNTTNFNRQAGEPNHCAFTNGASAWLSVQPLGSGVMTITTDGSSFDTVLAIYTGTTLASLTPVACDNNAGADGLDSRMVIDVTGGTTYQIVVDGVNAASGTAVLNFTNNQAPTITDLSNQLANEDTIVGPLAFSIGDAETPPASLIVTPISSNTNLVPAQNMIIGGAGANRTITIIPSPNQSGSATITVVITDAGGQWTSDSFVATFSSINDPPVLSFVSGRYLQPGQTLRITNNASDVDLPAQSLTFSLDPGFPAGAAINPVTGVFTWTPLPYQAASTNTITVRVTDNGSPNQSDTESFFVAVLGALPKVSINEWLASNVTTLSDPADGVFEDWIELFNAETNVVDLSGYYLMDAAPPLQTNHWRLPAGTLIPPQGYLLVWADNQTNQAGLHAGFRLSSGGETITLGTPDRRVLDSVGFYQQTNDVSGGRWPDGAAAIVSMARPTPLAPNFCPPIITLQPQSTSAPFGGAASFLVEARGTWPLSYQWQQDGLNLAGQTNATLTISTLQFSEAGLYSVRVTNIAGSSHSANAVLTVQTPPGLTFQPTNITTYLGSNVTFTATASGSGPLFYQWRLNGQNLPGATNPVLTIINAQLTNGGSYSVVVANGVNAISSREALLRFVLPELPAGDNFSQRLLLTNANGLVTGSNFGATKEGAETNHVGKAGGKSVWYTWLAPSNGIATFRTSGSPFDTLLAVYSGLGLTNLSLVAADEDSGGFFGSEVRFNAVAGNYYVVAIDGLGGVSGDFVVDWRTELTAQSTPRILVQPSSMTVPAGGTALFSVSAQSGNLTYQWFFNSVLITNVSASSATLVRSNVQPQNVGTYQVRVINSFGRFVVSQPFVLEIGPFPDRRSEDKFEDLFPSTPPGFARAAGANSVSIGTLASQVLNSSGATKGLSETNHCAVIGGASRWYSLKAGADGTFVIDTQGSAFDTVLAAYVGNDLFSLRVIDCNDNAFPGVKWSRLSFPATNGIEYNIAMDGTFAAGGVVPLNWAFGHPPDHQVTLAPPVKSLLKAGESLSLATRLTHGNPPAQYQWFRDGGAIRDATNETFQIGPGGNGVYSVVASNAIAVVREVVAEVNVELPLRLGMVWEQGTLSGMEERFLRLTGTASRGFRLLRSADLQASITVKIYDQPLAPLDYREPSPSNSPPQFYWAVPWP
jgi:hypothetical protein